MSINDPISVQDTQELLASGKYVANESLATALFLSLSLKRPLFLEGEAGVGKTEIAKVLSEYDFELIKKSFENYTSVDPKYIWEERNR